MHYVERQMVKKTGLELSVNSEKKREILRGSQKLEEEKGLLSTAS